MLQKQPRAIIWRASFDRHGTGGEVMRSKDCLPINSVHFGYLERHFSRPDHLFLASKLVPGRHR